MSIVFAGLLVVFGLLSWLVVPPVIVEGGKLAQNAPGYLRELLDQQWVKDLDTNYQVIDKIQHEFESRVTDQSFLSGLLGGVLGVGRAVVNGIFQVFTILVLSLYFLASLPRMKQACYALVPHSRRVRVESLSEEILRRVKPRP